MNCEKYQELISCLVDGEINPEEKIERLAKKNVDAWLSEH